ncbi:hypothetical protein GCM10023100_43340 [Actinocorallia cavernae]|uniref:Uncharacterized protein n=1 Tax=Actinocorallia cavernae TaxID=328075 RepID=A0ABP8STA1_9ACTN
MTPRRSRAVPKGSAPSAAGRTYLLLTFTLLVDVRKKVQRVADIPISRPPDCPADPAAQRHSGTAAGHDTRDRQASTRRYT